MMRYRSALMAGLLALAVAVCDDDGTVVQPPPVVNVSPPDVTVTVPPAPPAVAPLTAMITPPSAEVGVDGMVDFAVGTSGGSGDASWTCTSSDTAVATVETTDTGCRATAVAGGGATITAAVTKGSESTNVAANLTVSTTADAFILVTNISGDMMTDASGLKGNVDVEVSVERGNQTFERLALNVDGMEVDAQDFGTAAADDAEQSVHTFTLSFDSHSYEEHGDHTDVAYMNGEHSIQATLKIAGRDELLMSNIMPVEFDNDDGYVVTADLGDNSVLDDDGDRWYGGPTNGHIVISALPVSYSGAAAEAVIIGLDGCEAEAYEGDDNGDDHGHGDDDHAVTDAAFEFDCDGEGADRDITLTVDGGDGNILNAMDLPKANIDMMGPGAPTFRPNPNDRENGWINAGVAFTSTSSKDKNAWLKKTSEGDGVGGYTPQLRFAAVPRGDADGGLTEALEATPLQMVPVGVAVPDSRADAYCVIASAVDDLGNESDLPDDEDGTCMMAGSPSVAAVEDDPNTGEDETMAAVEATGYTKLLEDLAAAEEAEDEDDIEDAMQALVDAGLRAGVDTSPPTAEFAGASLGKNSKTVNINTTTATDPTIQYILHLDDNRGLRAGEPVVDTLVYRDDDGDLDGVMTTVARQTTPDDSPLYDVSFANDGMGYYTYMAQAQDMAGNLSEEITRTALHDTTVPVSALIFARGDDAFEYDKTLVMADNLSVRGYSMVVQATNLPSGVGGVRLKHAMVDAYNGALTQSETLRGAVEIPFIAVGGATPDGSVAQADVLASITAYVTDQAGNSHNDVETLSISVEEDGDLETDEGVIAGTYTLAVEDDDGAITAENTVTRSDETITLTATADVALATTVNPFADGVMFYAQVGGINTEQVGTGTDRVELRMIGMVAGNSAELDTGTSREWTYETEVSADDFYAIVGSSAGDYNVHALGINGSGVAHVMTFTPALTIAKR